MIKLQHYDIAIVGSGPAGLMNAYKNVLNSKKVLIIEAGRNRTAAHCNISNLKGNCINCNPCNNISGFGGCAAPNNSMKLSFPPTGKRLIELLGEKECNKSAYAFWNFYSMFANLNLPFPKVNINSEQAMAIIKKMGADFVNYPIHIFDEIEHNTFLKNAFKFLNEKCKILLNTEID